MLLYIIIERKIDLAKKEEKEIKVSSGTVSKSLAGCISTYIEQGIDVKLTAVGAGALNQMYKALAIARGFLALKGMELLIIPGFGSFTDSNGVEKSTLIAKVVIR